MTLLGYNIILFVAVVLYLIGIAIHQEVKQTFQEIDEEMKKTSSWSIIGRGSPISYSFFLAHSRAQRVYWVVNGLFSFVALIVLVLWFGFTIIVAVDKEINFSDPINVIELFGVFGILQPTIVFIITGILFYYWNEARLYNKWRK